MQYPGVHEAIESERIQALTLLAASVAHEIGNPLNALHIHLQLMERELKKLAGGKTPARGGAVTADVAATQAAVDEALAARGYKVPTPGASRGSSAASGA